MKCFCLGFPSYKMDFDLKKLTSQYKLVLNSQEIIPKWDSGQRERDGRESVLKPVPETRTPVRHVVP